LLRVLQLGEFERVGSSRTTRVDARVIAATNADLRAEVAAGRFREDLFFRLNTIEIRLPPLRERREDLRTIAMQSLHRYGARYGKAVKGFHHTALNQMLSYAWPGNIRELEHAVERAVLLARGPEVMPQDLGLDVAGAHVSARAIDEMPLEDVEKILIQKALARAGGNVSQAARALGLSRGALYRRMEQHGL
jgi:DNA-binding NtrC family response regulator